MPHEILIMLPTTTLGDEWAGWLERMRAADGFVGAREIGDVWHVLLAPATPAAEVARDFFNARNGIKPKDPAVRGWKAQK